MGNIETILSFFVLIVAAVIYGGNLLLRWYLKERRRSYQVYTFQWDRGQQQLSHSIIIQNDNGEVIVFGDDDPVPDDLFTT